MDAIVGHRLDKLDQGQSFKRSNDITTIFQDAIEIAKEFFKLLIDILITVLMKKYLFKQREKNDKFKTN
jgi:hypothetical protein